MLQMPKKWVRAQSPWQKQVNQNAVEKLVSFLNYNFLILKVSTQSTDLKKLSPFIKACSQTPAPIKTKSKVWSGTRILLRRSYSLRLGGEFFTRNVNVNLI